MDLIDDIEVKPWLEEIGMEAYAEVFALNFSLGGNFLSRKRLSELRLKDYPQLNIENFDHAKLLHDHVTHTLQFPFHSEERRAEVLARRGVPTESEGGEGGGAVMPHPPIQSKPSTTRPVTGASSTETPSDVLRDDDEEAVRAATVIQTKMKGKQVEKRVEQRRQSNAAAALIQNKFKSSDKGQEIAKRVEEKQRAATVIQTKMKEKFVDRSVCEETKDGVTLN